MKVSNMNSNNRSIEVNIPYVQENKPFKFSSVKEKGNSITR